MSLFKIRDFWSFDLTGLQLETQNSRGIDSFSDPDDDCQEGTFISSVGRFNSIGQQDVFVCGNLQGSIFILQVPVLDQRKYIKRASTNESMEQPQTDGSGSAQSHGSINDRQLLAATSLQMPIVDIKCGYFVSAIKQSIAVLSFDKLLILQVKLHEPVDLMTDSNLSAKDSSGEKNISPGDLSHEFEEHIRLDLLTNEFACGLVVLNSHADSSLKGASHTDTIKEANLDATTRRKLKQETNKFMKQSKLIVQQLHLPQRDKLIVQYVNQFLFSLVDGKKITGHFSIDHSHLRDNSDGTDPKAMKISQSLGSMPMAYLHCNNASPSIVLSFSDYNIHCVPVEKLVSQARHDVMKRVASNLLQSGESPSEFPANDKVSSLSSTSRRISDQTRGIISVDIDSISEWNYEMLAMPLQMSSEQRRTKNVTATGHKSESNVSQLLVMSRYSFDLFSACGQHLWSQRFETPLIWSFTYVLERQDNDKQEDLVTIDDGNLKVQLCDKLISLLCTDSLSASKSNLVILEENRVQWSALMNAKPFMIWRLNLAHMPGLLAILDIKQGQLVVSYLGTNSDSDGRDENISERQEDLAEAEDITKLETIDEPLLTEDRLSVETSTQESLQTEQRRRLTFEASLEASGKWPNVMVDIVAAIHLDPESSGVIYNLVATLEYDDLLRFNVAPSDDQSIAMLSYPSAGVARIKLGNCWPDRKEPLYLKGNFSLIHSQNGPFGVGALDELESNREDLQSNASSALSPKSLKVQVVLSYHETHSSLLFQEESFLLPISMISQLTHIDYSSGNDQSIDDVLNNLTDYKGAASKSSQSYQFCDLFLQLDLDMVEFLNEFVERDLVCRRGNSIQTKGQEKRNKMEEQIETMENINLLAQSLDCRLRYKNPGRIARQLSEEIILPAMASFAIRVDRTPSLDVIENSTREINSSSNVVWIHICDMNSNSTFLIEQFVMRHTKDWMQYFGEGGPEVELERPERGINNLLVAIECETSWPLMLVLSHMLERAAITGGFDAQTAVSLIRRHDHKAFESVYRAIKYGHHLAISTTLHDSLSAILNTYETRHKDRFKALCDKLAREECKFHIVTKAILSLSKQLPNLPELQRLRLMRMGALAKHCQQEISSILRELGELKETDVQFSKLPNVPHIKLRRSARPAGEEVWPCVARLID